jgi:hypothetical protein
MDQLAQQRVDAARHTAIVGMPGANRDQLTTNFEKIDLWFELGPNMQFSTERTLCGREAGNRLTAILSGEKLSSFRGIAI